MGLMDNIGGLAGMAGGGGQQSALVRQLLSMLTSGQGGGLSGLVNQFNSAGLGPIISSWIATGANQPISPDQVTAALGHDKVQQLAAGAGVPPEQARNELAQLLPGLVDKLTPNGSVPPEGDLMKQGASLLGNLFK